MDIRRENRKHEHIKIALKQKDGPLKAGWDDIKLVHQALAKLNLGDIKTNKKVFGKELKMPLIINALTGGATGLDKINSMLAHTAREWGIGLAVGSQTAAIRNKALRHTYDVVRKHNPNGLIMANVSALVKPSFACEAVEMIEADVLQLHLNPVQELLMEEGDRDFTGMLENIQEIVQQVKVPVLVKEVGFGISREAAFNLYKMGISAIDTNGAGGTNFAGIEIDRRQRQQLEYMKSWGIPSAISLLEVMDLKLPITIMASGGVRTALDMIKALAIGADIVGIAGPMLKVLLKQGEDELNTYLDNLYQEMKIQMLLLGTDTVHDIKQIPVVITGQVKEWCEQRSISTKDYSIKNRGGEQI